MKSRSFKVLLKLGSNTSWLFLERAIGITLAVGVGLYFARYLGRSNFGLYSYVFALYGLFSVSSKLGLSPLAVSETVRSGYKHSAIMGSVFALRMAASIACLLLLNLTAWFLGDGPLVAEMTLIFSVALLFGPFETIIHWFEATVQMKPIVVARSTTSILMGIARLSMIVAGLNLLWFAWLIPLEAIVMGGLFLVAYHREGLRIRDWKTDTRLLRQFIREGTPLFFSAIAVIAYMKIDQVMLGKMASSAEVGTYSAAVKISEMFYFIPVVLSGLLFPYLIKISTHGEQITRKAFQVMCDSFAWAAILIAIPVSFFSVQLTELAYGPDYLPSARILVVHIWAGIFVFVETLRSKWLIMHNIARFQVWTTMLGAVSNVLLNLYLIPRYQGYGAAIATTISYGFAVVFSCFLHKGAWEIGIILVKSMLAPLRIVDSLRSYNAVKAVVDAEQG
jgi:O-antigen/teichoic acid export membrane protein